MSADGNRSTKADELAYIRDNEWDPGEFEYRIERLQIYRGQFAIVDGTGIATNYTYKSSNVPIKDSGECRALSSHVSGVNDRSEDGA